MMQILGFRGSASKKTSFAPQSLPGNSTPSPSTVFVGPDRPLRLVYCDDNGKFRMAPEAVAALRLVKGPIRVVSVCGLARQGKSFILNQLLHLGFGKLLSRSSGFQVASTHRPCTKGLWMWSAPLKRTALDGTEYYLLLLDSEGINAYDQTGTYSIQIFSLAVLLSSIFIFNQMGGIDETALESLSLVTEITKHIHVRASEGRIKTSELGQFSPVFVWLLRDFYLDLVEDDRKIKPREYLEQALRPMQGGGSDMSAKNEIRESIRALFPDRECFTLVRPLNNENDLQQLDQLSLNKLRPEFQLGLDALSKYVFERTRPKQVGDTVMTGPILACITQSFLDAINNGAVPTISSSWQSVEEAECRRAYDSATEVYMSAFDRTKPPEEVILREAHDNAVQKSLAAFTASIVGMGSTRHKYEKLLQNFLTRAFEEFKRNAFREADMRCSNTIQSMEKELWTACHVPEAKPDHVIKVLGTLISEYEVSSHGPGKWQKLSTFLQQSLEGPIHDLVKKHLDQTGSEKTALILKCCLRAEKLGLLQKQLEASEKDKADYLRCFEESIDDKNKMVDDYMSHMDNLWSQCSLLEERCSSLVKDLDASADWKRKYEQCYSKHKAEEDKANAEIAAIKSRSSAMEARLAAALELASFAQAEASEWKQKFDIAVREAKSALEKAARIQEHTNEHRQRREDALREEFSTIVAEKEEEIKEKQAKIECVEHHLTSLNSQMKAADFKLKKYDLENSTLKLEIKELSEKFDSAKATAQFYEKEAQMMQQEKTCLEQKYQSEFKRFQEAEERCEAVEKQAKRAAGVATMICAEAAAAQKEKNDVEQLAMERPVEIDKVNRQIDNLERQKAELMGEDDMLQVSASDAVSKIELLEKEVEDGEKVIEKLLKSNNEQRASTIQVLGDLLEAEQVV